MDIKTTFVEVFFKRGMATEITLEELFQKFSQWAIAQAVDEADGQVTEDQATAIKAEASQIVNELMADLNYESRLAQENEVISEKRINALKQQVTRLSEILNITLENTDD